MKVSPPDQVATSPRPGELVRRAWIAVAVIPVFFVVSLIVGSVGYALLGYKPEANDQPLWVDLVVGVPTLLVFLAPCVVAAVFGLRATRSGDRRGLWPAVMGVVAAGAMTVLTVVTIVQTAVS